MGFISTKQSRPWGLTHTLKQNQKPNRCYIVVLWKQEAGSKLLLWHNMNSLMAKFLVQPWLGILFLTDSKMYTFLQSPAQKHQVDEFISSYQPHTPKPGQGWYRVLLRLPPREGYSRVGLNRKAFNAISSDIQKTLE